MKTPAIIASLTVAGSIAFAAGQQSGGRQSPPMPSGAQAHSMQEEMSEARMAQLTGCQTDPATWFNPIPKRIRLCVGSNTIGNTVGRIPINAADVNADGILEFFDILDGQDVQIRSNETPPTTKPLLLQSVTVNTETETVVYRNSVIDVGASTGEFVYQALTAIGWNTATKIYLSPAGWRDVDHDGDLDLVCSAYWYSSAVIGTWSTDFWFENIGYEASQPPLAADLNGDGQVNGADLGLLLVAWGPNP
jgi:hypothetical protein